MRPPQGDHEAFLADLSLSHPTMPPIHQSANRYYDHHETFHGPYTNFMGQHATGQGVIINFQAPNPLQQLHEHCSHSAAFDSAARFPPPRCARSTRLELFRIIEEWIHTDRDYAVQSSLFWLHGGAGAGKSAVAQTLSEKFQEREHLAASFFFFRGDATRNNGDRLIPTIVSHLVNTFREIVPFVEDRIRQHRALFTKQYQIQIQKLLVEPLLALISSGANVTHPRLIVIDGLDECQNPDVQCELLRVIAHAIRLIPYPLRFLITSRPEAHITRVFKHDCDLQAIPLYQYNLSEDPNADEDIRMYLEEEFAEIRRVHCLWQYIPRTWPNRSAISSLVKRSSGHFIYASTVIRYIQSPKHRPDDRLEVILRLRPPQRGDRPYDQLDALYELIFGGVERPQLEMICLVLGILYFQSNEVGFFTMVHDYTIEELLRMRAGDLILLLDPILSLVVVDRDNVRVLHKCLFDYLLDPTRSGHLPFDLSRVHESAATFILKRWIVGNVCDIGYFRDFAYHCQYAVLNETLKGYLHSLQTPIPESVLSIAKMFPSWDHVLNESLLSIMWYFFRTLSRKDFDSTGQVHGHYVAKWMSHLLSADLIGSACRSRAAVKVDKLKHELDMLFSQWTLPDFNPSAVEMFPDERLTLIIQEHHTFSTYIEASFSANTNAIASSLIFGKYFVHSYNFGIRDNMFTFLILRTYLGGNTACHQKVRAGHLNIVQETQGYLKSVEKYLLSGLYQKYGVGLDQNIFDNT